MKRQPDRDNSKHDRLRKNRRPIRLVLEPLEARRLLAGLNVSVFVDRDGSRSVDAADTAATRRVVFLDLNNNGQQDSSDPIAFTNASGIATFEDIAEGDYGVGVAAGSSLQSQSFPVRVEELATRVGPAASALIASDDLLQVWAFDSSGQGQSVSAGSESLKVELGGAIASSVNVGGEAWVITKSAVGQSGTKLTQFNLSSGTQSRADIRGLSGRVVDKLVKVGAEVVAQLSGPRGIELAKLTVVDGVPAIGSATPFPNLASVSGGTNQLAVIEYQRSFSTSDALINMQPVASKLSVLSLNDFSVQATTTLRQSADEVAFSADSSLVLAAFSTGGVVVLNNDVHLSAVATLAEATGPLLTQSKDGRLVTGNSANESEFIIWDTRSWQPSGRTQVLTSEPTQVLSSGVVSQAILAISGDRLVATGNVGTVVSELAQAATARVTVSNEGYASVQLGVRSNGVNRAPSASPLSTVLLEDNATGGQMRSQVTDFDNDTLWFSIVSSPSHGRLRVSPTGDWVYQPVDNFNGTDRAIVRVFDGQSSSDVAVLLNVSPVNDAPEELRVDLQSIAENVGAAGAVDGLGFLTVFDVDRGARYQFETSDPRFQVRNGRIYLAPDAKLDFESEPSIELEIIATEDAISGYQISTTATISIADVNEAPTAVRILDATVSENSSGATIGRLEVEDPDALNRFEYVLSDPRFVVENGLLKLKPDVELDFEATHSISLSITVSDSSGQSITQPISFTVADANDAPTAIDFQVVPIQEGTPGAVVGTVLVDDQDDQAYAFNISDPRFEVVDGQLKLKEDQTVNLAIDAGLSVTVEATSIDGGDKISSTVTVPVVPKKSPSQNPIEPCDVNGDGEVTPIDALILINYLNSHGPGPVGRGGSGGSGESKVWLDVNGDGVISPIDVLLVVNALNRQRLIARPPSRVEPFRSEGEASPSVSGLSNSFASVEIQNDVRLASSEDMFPTLSVNTSLNSIPLGETEVDGNPNFACSAFEARGDSERDSEIDQELESLLDQLTQERLGFLDA